MQTQFDGSMYDYEKAPCIIRDEYIKLWKLEVLG